MEHGEAGAVHTCRAAQAAADYHHALSSGGALAADHCARHAWWNIALIAAMVALLRWPDRRLAGCFPKVFRMIECVEPSSVFRPLVSLLSRRQFQRLFSGRCSCAVCGDLSKPHRDVELVAKLVCQEEMKRTPIQAVDRAGMDRLFGTEGWWRPMPLFALRQNNKHRLIADGRRGGHSGHTNEQESLLLPNVEFVAFAVRGVILAIREEEAVLAWRPMTTALYA